MRKKQKDKKMQKTKREKHAKRATKNVLSRQLLVLRTCYNSTENAPVAEQENFLNGDNSNSVHRVEDSPDADQKHHQTENCFNTNNPVHNSTDVKHKKHFTMKIIQTLIIQLRTSSSQLI